MHTLETKLGYVFHRPELLENALYHSSYANEHRGTGISSNERLEFLGDAVLGFVTAEYLYAKHPDMPEGDLTRIRAALVCEESLHEVAQSLDLGNYLLLGKGDEDFMYHENGRVPWKGDHHAARECIRRYYLGENGTDHEK